MRPAFVVRGLSAEQRNAASVVWPSPRTLSEISEIDTFKRLPDRVRQSIANRWDEVLQLEYRGTDENSQVVVVYLVGVDNPTVRKARSTALADVIATQSDEDWDHSAQQRAVSLTALQNRLRAKLAANVSQLAEYNAGHPLDSMRMVKSEKLREHFDAAMSDVEDRGRIRLELLKEEADAGRANLKAGNPAPVGVAVVVGRVPQARLRRPKWIISSRRWRSSWRNSGSIWRSQKRRSNRYRSRLKRPPNSISKRIP